MNDESQQATETEEVTPRPTYAPIAMSMGIMMLAWGILTHWTISLAGAVIFAWALWNWMDEITTAWGKES